MAGLCPSPSEERTHEESFDRSYSSPRSRLIVLAYIITRSLLREFRMWGNRTIKRNTVRAVAIATGAIELIGTLRSRRSGSTG